MRVMPGQGFKLRNNGGLEILFIGTGSAFATTMNQTNFLIVKGDTHVMVDFGMTAPHALLSTTGLSATDIQVILPTHSHADHIGGIECLALMNRYVGIPFKKAPKLKMVITEEYQRVLWDCSLRGGLEGNEESEMKKLQFADFFVPIRPKWKAHQPREIWEVQIGDLHLEIFRTMHIPQQSGEWEASWISYGLFVDGRVFISGDTRFDPALIELYAKRSEAMFHDVQFFPGAVHAFLEELKTLPAVVKAKMLLVHYNDNWREQDISGFAGFAQQGVSYIFD